MGRPLALCLTAAGAVGGALGLHRALRGPRTAVSSGPVGPAHRAGGLREAARGFAADVAAGAAQREHELRVALQVDIGAMDPGEARALLEHPTAPHPRQR